MRYTEWITELKDNLLQLSEGERKRIADYYAEAYADRRAAGFSEKEIIDGFGAPYDAAQAVLEGEFYRETPKDETPREEIKKPAEEAPAKEVAPTETPAKEVAHGRPSFIFAAAVCGVIFLMVLTALVAAAGTAFIVSGIHDLILGYPGGGLAVAGIGMMAVGIAVCAEGLLIKLYKFVKDKFSAKRRAQ